MQKNIYFFFLCFLPFGLSAQNNEQFYNDLSQAWKAGNVKSLAVMLHDEVEYSKDGKAGRLSRLEVEGELNTFFAGSRPLYFTLKHKGSSQDGQLYLIGQLETETGSQYRIICRAKTHQAAFRIFRLDVELGG